MIYKCALVLSICLLQVVRSDSLLSCQVVTEGLESETQNQCNCTFVRSLIQQAINNAKKCSGVVYGGRCIRFIYTSGYGMSKPDARNMCVYHGGTLVDILNQEMFNLIYNYAKEAWDAYIDRNVNYVEIWLASVYEDGSIRSSTTGEPIYTTWHPGFPTHITGFHSVGLVVATKASRGSLHGMFNHAPNHPYLVPLCSFTI
uniref:Uncharacterized LOC100182235 n=1 Tax=Ciona intestinalis TaxID=7719 RepID=F6W9V3_CIOIN|nr:uncharacterized protein LOC100182235 [Ciona intestinalis]|eukprot:XP_002128531.1 uncharacterized protein LOC100182235 [Ciona intestinalis]